MTAAIVGALMFALGFAAGRCYYRGRAARADAELAAEVRESAARAARIDRVLAGHRREPAGGRRGA